VAGGPRQSTLQLFAVAGSIRIALRPLHLRRFSGLLFSRGRNLRGIRLLKLWKRTTQHTWPEGYMTEEGGPDGTSKLEQAKAALQSVTDTVQSTTRTVAGAIEAGRRPGAPLDQLAGWTREAPLHAVLVAFLIGWIAGRRR
jgi:hypothetical protein